MAARFRCALFALFPLLLTAAAPPVKPLVGAIRWDAWYGGPVTREVEETLAPEHYHDRLPFFADVLNDQVVHIDGDKPDVMDREIRYAVDAGIDFWAFVGYPVHDPMSRALDLYLANAHRDQIHFALILHRNFSVPDGAWPEERKRALTLLKDPACQHVLGNRPLVFALDVPAERFEDFHQTAEAQGLHPYCVYMGWNPAADKATLARGFDAVGAYAYGSDAPTFSELARAVEENYWEAAAAADVPCVPLVTTGWDKRPRQDHPVLWEQHDAYLHQLTFPAQASPAQIAQHLEHGLAFVSDHPQICPAKALLMYAWNEHDEGGWIEPTWSPDHRDNTGRLAAIRNVLRPGVSEPSLGQPPAQP